MCKMAELPKDKSLRSARLFCFGSSCNTAVGERGDEKSGSAAVFVLEEILRGMRKKIISTIRFVDWY